MLRCLTLLCLLAAFFSGQDRAAAATPYRQNSLPDEGVQYALMQFSIPVDPASYRNPFDAADIEVIGIFQSPTGKQLIIPGFWMQPYACTEPCENFDLRPTGEPVWQLRLTPQEAGDWSYTLQVRDNGAITTVLDGRFTVAASDARGFIRKGANGRYFQFTNGDPYFPVGHNLNWSFDAAGGLETYDQWLRELSEAGGNYARLNIDVPWFISLEWAGPAGDYRGSQKAAAELDAILARAEAYGVYLQLILLWHQSLRTYTTPPVVLPESVARPDVSPDWDNHPYNVLNGGPLSGPSVFFVNEQSRDLFRQRLRYIIARWSYSPQIFAWELIDQIDRTANYNPQAAGDWLRSTINYVRQIDQHDHLITASSREYDPVIAENALLDFAGAQFYQRRPIETVGDQVVNVVNRIERYLEAGFAPVMLVDYSLNPWFEPTGDDPDGIHFQNTLWAAALSGASGGAMSDWWDTYVIPQGLTRYYAPLAAFTAGIDWPNLDLRPAQAGLLSEQVNTYMPVRLSNFRRQFAARPEDVITRTITSDGVLPDISSVPSFLYGQVFNTQFSQAQRYRVAPPVDTYLEVAVRAVSTQAGARLVIQVDGVTAAELSLRAGNRDVTIRVPLRAGEHIVTIDNLGDDWLELEYIEVGQMIAPARVLTLRDSQAGVALAWLQHRDYTWERVAADVTRTPVLFDYQLGNMPAGRYVAEIWDPLGGAVLGEELIRVDEDGLLRFTLVPMDSQLAIRAVRQPDPPTPEPTEVASEIPPASPTPAPSLTPTRTPTATVTATASLIPSATPTVLSPTPKPSATIRVGATPLATLVPLLADTHTPRPASSATPDS
jgi:hypothetical protein